MTERFLITGGLGCVGAWVARTIAQEGNQAVIYDPGTDDARLRLITTAEERERIRFVPGDVTDVEALMSVIADGGITHVVHLAALQAPYCRDDPVLGAQVNVVGTVAVFEAVAGAAMSSTVAYASSAAAYDPSGRGRPSTLYGVFKLADEGVAEVYARDRGVRSVGLRPACVYGPGRDRGITAAVTEAMVAAGAGRPYRLPFCGRLHLHFAGDVAAAFVAAARSGDPGALVRAMPSEGLVDMRDLVAMLDRLNPGAASWIEIGDSPLPFPEELPGVPLEIPLTSLIDGIHATQRVAVGV